MIEYQERIDLLLYTVLIVNILRIIQCTSLHPRLASLTGTLSKAMDDLWHTSVHIFLVLGLFSAVGTWRFGSARTEFVTLSVSFTTLLNMMFSGGFIENWDESLDLQGFMVLFLILVVLLILNFLLAKIVDACGKIQEHKEELDIEQNFISDLFWVLVSRVYQYSNKWPGSKTLAAELQKLPAKFNISYYHLKATKLFKTDDDQIYSFMNFYKEFEFMKPVKFTRFGKRPTSKKEREFHVLVKTIHELNMEFHSELCGVSAVDVENKKTNSADDCTETNCRVHEAESNGQELQNSGYFPGHDCQTTLADCVFLQT